MPFDRLASADLKTPEFHPSTAFVMPRPPIGPLIAQGAAQFGGVLANVLDPLTVLKRQVAIQQLKMQQQAIQAYNSGSTNSGVHIDKFGRAVFSTQQDIDRHNESMQRQTSRGLGIQTKQIASGVAKGDPSLTHASDFGAAYNAAAAAAQQQLPQQSSPPDPLPNGPVEPDTLNGADSTDNDRAR